MLRAEKVKYFQLQFTLLLYLFYFICFIFYLFYATPKSALEMSKLSHLGNKIPLFTDWAKMTSATVTFHKTFADCLAIFFPVRVRARPPFARCFKRRRRLPQVYHHHYYQYYFLPQSFSKLLGLVSISLASRQVCLAAFSSAE